MRVIEQDISRTIELVRKMKGLDIMLEVNRGRNRIEEIEGVIENVYPAIFTIRNKEGEISSFSYSDILAKNILFYRNRKKNPKLNPN